MNKKCIGQEFVYLLQEIGMPCFFEHRYPSTKHMDMMNMAL